MEKYLFENRCNLKNECMVVSTNEEFGDPCHGTYKYLSLQYACLPDMNNGGMMYY